MSGERLNPFQHVLKRPDTYIGSIKTIDKQCYVFDLFEDSKNSIKIKDAKWNSGLFNIIREIGSNCIDNKWRSQGTDTEMNTIKIAWDSETRELSFWNDGKCIPVVKQNYDYKDHRSGKTISEEFYPAEVFFGEMLAGTNFNDDEERKTSGKNGMGSKAVAVFSKVFTVEHVDPNHRKKFIQTYTDNATNRTKPKVTTSASKGYTKISFKIDFERFGYDVEKYHSDFIGLLGMYVLEITAMIGLPITFTVDGKLRKFYFKSFDKYVRMFYPETSAHKLESIILHNGDECVVVESHVDPRMDIPDMLESARHMAFVNGLKTKDGGVHVDAWRDAICSLFVRAFNSKKNKGVQLKTSAKELYPYLTFFIRSEVSNPSFDSQTKDYLNGPVYKIFPTDSKTKVEKIKQDLDKVVKKMMKWNFIKLLEEKLIAKTGRTKNKKTVKKRVDLGDKAQDANNAGKYPSNTKCTLYIAEGLSAKAMVVRGISNLNYDKNGKIVSSTISKSFNNGQDYNGAFAIQGKFINVLNATPTAIENNAESNLLREMLNLRLKCDYSKDENWNTLRYHKVCITTDMDDDGIHIRGLLLNFFYTLWPSLLERGFVVSFSTAVAKVSFVNKTQPKLFYSNPEYKEWYEKSGKELKIAEVKYLKGLGSIHPTDVPGYFNNPKVVSYYTEGDEKEYMDMGFNDKNSDMRKEWITRDFENEDDDEGEFVYDGDLGISTFVDSQLVIYHKMTLRRALPNYMDGFKESQRKAFYAIRLKNYKKTKDLEKVTGAVKEITGYHHGGASLLSCIKNMAIRYPGSNNIPLLQDDGEYGCVDPETKILLWNGKIISAKNVKKDDLLVGDDGKYRKIHKLVKGVDMMYRVKQSNGMDYIVNSVHILTLYDSDKGIIDINIQDYLSHSQKDRFKGIYIKLESAEKGFDNHTLEYCDIIIEQEGVGKYVGWHIDGNERFLLADGTVTHNTRLTGGKDAAAARYIATALEDISKHIFKDVDDNIINNVIEDNETAEYEFFLPVICMLLINGSEGIASGFSTSIYNYNPIDILDWTRSWLEGEHANKDRLVPWYRGIKGEISLVYDKKYKDPVKWKTKGILKESEKGWWDIKDLPVGKWTNSFKDELSYLETGESINKKKTDKWVKCISDYKDYSDTNFVHFRIKPCGDWRPNMNTTLTQLQTTKSLSNMVAIDKNNKPTRYKSAEEILEKWCADRLYYYDLRRKYIIDSLNFDIKKARNKYEYVKNVINKKLNMHQEDDKLEKTMVDIGLSKMTGSFIGNGKLIQKESFDYLLNMQMRSMSKRKLEELKNTLDIAEEKLRKVQNKTSKDLWKEDLDEFENAYNKYINSRNL